MNDLRSLILIALGTIVWQFSFAQEEKMVVEGAIVISDSEAPIPAAGTVRWNGQDFQGFDGTQWRTFAYVIDGLCGTSHGDTFSVQPSTNLCAQGSATNQTSTATEWTWDCQGMNGGSTISCSANRNSGSLYVTDDFAGNGSLLNYSTNNAIAVPGVTRTNGRYRAEVLDNTGNITLHFHGAQGRLDAKVVAFPFEYIVRNIGIGTLANSQIAPPTITSYVFAGIQAHVYPDFNSRNSSHFVVGHRGGTENTVEGKNTVNGSSTVNDAGVNVVPDGRADLRLVGLSDNTILWYYQVPNFNVGGTPDNWIAYRGTGLMPGTPPVYGDSIYIGPITYAYGSNNVPFVGTIDGIELVGETPQ